MTFLEAQQLTSDWLDDPNNGYFGLTLLKKRLNLAHLELQKDLLSANEDYYTKCVETTLMVGQYYYKLPSDFIDLIDIGIVISGSSDTRNIQWLDPLPRLERRNLLSTQRGTPYFYYLEKNHVLLDPSPDSAKTLVLEYSYRVQDLVNDNDEFDAPAHYQEFIPILAARDGFIKDGRDLAPIERKLTTYSQRLIKDAENRRKSQSRRIIRTGGY